MKHVVKCPVCKKSESTFWASAVDAEYMTTTESFQFHQCKTCQVLFIDPVPTDKLDTIYPSNYYSFSSTKISMISKVKMWIDCRIFKKLLSQLKGDSLNILDVGGGAGSQLNSLRSIEKRELNTYIIDLDSKAEQSAINDGHNYFCSRIEDYETELKFDFVLLLNLIEHVEDPRKVLSKIRSILTPQGIVLIKTPNYDSLDARLFRHNNWGGYHCPRHWVLFTKESFVKLATETDLNIEHFSYTQGAPFWAQSILFWLFKKDMIKVTQEKPMVYHPLFGLLSAVFAGIDFIRRPFSKTSQMFFVLKTESGEEK